MKAKVKYRVNLENHVELGEVAPLEEPFVIALDPSSACNFKCKFCPTGDHELIKKTGRYNGIMDFELYKKIIDDIKMFKKPLKTLRLYKNGEPLINRNFSKMVGYAKQSGYISRIDTTTNGFLLNKKLNREIVDGGLDQINISVNGIDEETNYYYTQTKINFSDYVENIKDLYLYSTGKKNQGAKGCEVSIKGIYENLSENNRKRFFDIFGDISDRIVLEHISPAWPLFSFDEIGKNFTTGNYGQDVIERKVCPYLFYIMVINADGTCSTCIGDWPNQQIVGDVHVDSVKDIWQGECLRGYQIDHLNGNRKNTELCAACEVIKYGTLDNMDACSEQILKRMRKV